MYNNPHAYLRQWVVVFSLALSPLTDLQTMPPRKRAMDMHAPQRPAVHKLRGRRGSLGAMPGIALDVIIEVCPNVVP